MLVLVAGLPGSGKSFFAEKLAEKLMADYINSDKIRKSLGSLGKYSIEDKLAIYQEMLKMAEKCLIKDEDVVADATFHLQSTRQLFFSLADEKTTPLIFFHIVADEELIKERISKPRKDSEADFQVYKKLKQEFEKILEPHLRIKSTQNNISVMLNQALRYIKDQNGIG